MFSTVSKAVLTGVACGTLGLGIGGVWAVRDVPAAEEPMRSLVKPLPVQMSDRTGELTPGSEPGREQVNGRSEADPTVVSQRATAPARPAADTNESGSSKPDEGEEGSALSITRLVVTDRIEGREPGTNKELRADGSEVFAFVELANRATEPQKIEIVFEHESGQQVGFVTLPVPKEKSRWRTWGKTRQIKTAGQWVAKVRDAAGTELMSQPFMVQG